MLSTAIYNTFLLVLVVARLFLGLGPAGLVLCLHGDGALKIESAAELCCEKPTCVEGRLPWAGVPRPQLESEDERDDCQDFAFTANDSLTSITHLLVAGGAQDLAVVCETPKHHSVLADGVNTVFRFASGVPRPGPSSLSRPLRC